MLLQLTQVFLNFSIPPFLSPSPSLISLFVFVLFFFFFFFFFFFTLCLLHSEGIVGILLIFPKRKVTPAESRLFLFWESQVERIFTKFCRREDAGSQSGNSIPCTLRVLTHPRNSIQWNEHLSCGISLFLHLFSLVPLFYSLLLFVSLSPRFSYLF